MARTSLMHWLLRVAHRVHRDQRLQQPGDTTVSSFRRTFLSRTAALSTAVLAANATPAWARSLAKPHVPRIAVIGAGLAGLTAAFILRKAGMPTTVYEGSGRLGGRCYSERDVFEQEQVAERGGEFIDTPHVEIMQLSMALNLELDDVLEAEPSGSAPYSFLNGQPYTIAEANKDFEAIYTIVQSQAKALGDDYGYQGSNKMARTLDRMSIAQWIDKYVPGGSASRFGRLLRNAYTEEFAAECERLSAINLIITLAPSSQSEFAPYAGSDQRFHVRGGNDQLVMRMAGALEGQIETRTSLTAIEKLSNGQIRLGLSQAGNVVNEVFDRVIIAIPFTTLRQVNFSRAGFRPLKQSAIRALPMGASTKLQLQFTERAWQSTGSNGEVRLEGSFHSTWEVTRAQSGNAGILNFWSGGKVAVAAGDGTKEGQAAKALKDLEVAIPGITEKWNGKVTRDAWMQNPWSQGSYAYYPPGWYTKYFGIEGEREGNCFFAGEHTSENWQGFLNGAVQSGMRAASDVMQSIGLHMHQPERKAK